MPAVLVPQTEYMEHREISIYFIHFLLDFNMHRYNQRSVCVCCVSIHVQTIMLEC